MRKQLTLQHNIQKLEFDERIDELGVLRARVHSRFCGAKKHQTFNALHRSIIIDLCKAQFLATTVFVKPVQELQYRALMWLASYGI